MRALGCHVFAGGFTQGVRKVFKCNEQMEIRNFGRDTCEALGITFNNCSDWHEWPDRRVDLLFGNPRCTGFSTTTSGYDDSIHGPSATCTKDIYDFCSYAIKIDVPIAIWESVPQAFSTGRPLIDNLIENVFPKKYRIAHVFVNAASFGNAQKRRRYFFVAYQTKAFNVSMPSEVPTVATIRQKIEHLEDFESPYHGIPTEMRPYYHLFKPGDTMFQVVQNHLETLRHTRYASKFEQRTSDIPFSFHQPVRLHYDGHCPTLSGSCYHLVHPRLSRTLTVKECATLMGWNNVPIGKEPWEQIAKGVCPEVGTWIAEQAYASLANSWGDDDFDSSYISGEFVGNNTHGRREKIFEMRKYYEPVRVDE